MSVLQYLSRFHFLNFILWLVVLAFRHSRNCNRTWISHRSACISSAFICRNFTIHFVYIVIRMRRWMRLREIWVGLTPWVLSWKRRSGDEEEAFWLVIQTKRESRSRSSSGYSLNTKRFCDKRPVSSSLVCETEGEPRWRLSSVSVLVGNRS